MILINICNVFFFLNHKYLPAYLLYIIIDRREYYLAKFYVGQVLIIRSLAIDRVNFSPQFRGTDVFRQLQINGNFKRIMVVERKISKKIRV